MRITVSGRFVELQLKYAVHWYIFGIEDIVIVSYCTELLEYSWLILYFILSVADDLCDRV